ncbi:hypothetical protein [Chamaesiphon sp. OTE_20_metabat_361]|uniref:hypothetical protein n=1 Tax=Chamaesiphon sp. OTE_20_metabat_361 TaxID=2964689 RepID=UPI00286CAC23|nr:hypothetical protein [Chamaesiphon sp. OTE_20_metabat_361]
MPTRNVAARLSKYPDTPNFIILATPIPPNSQLPTPNSQLPPLVDSPPKSGNDSKDNLQMQRNR